MSDPSKLLVHYRFIDDSHAMDAIVRNKCEAELLAIAYEIAMELGIDFHLESEALQEGGLKEIWGALGKNSDQIAIVLSTAAIILTLTAGDAELDTLKKQETRLNIEEKKLNIEKLKRDLKQGNFKSAEERAAKQLQQNRKVLKRRSNFYSHLQHHNKVTSVAYCTLDSNNAPLAAENLITRAQFPDFILHTDQLEPLSYNEALIEIVSPVLGGRRGKWRGIFEQDSVSFNVKDRIFLNAVESGAISFRHGSQIRCVLQVDQKLSETGEIVISGYHVQTVLETIDGSLVTRTHQGIQHRANRSIDQADLFDGEGNS